MKPWWPSGLTYGFSNIGPWVRNKDCASVFSRIHTRNYIWNLSRAFVSYVRELAQTSEPIQRCVWSFLSTKEPRGDCGPSSLILTGACAWIMMMNCTKQNLMQLPDRHTRNLFQNKIVTGVYACFQSKICSLSFPKIQTICTYAFRLNLFRGVNKRWQTKNEQTYELCIGISGMSYLHNIHKKVIKSLL